MGFLDESKKSNEEAKQSYEEMKGVYEALRQDLRQDYMQEEQGSPL